MSFGVKLIFEFIESLVNSWAIGMLFYLVVQWQIDLGRHMKIMKILWPPECEAFFKR